MKYTNNENFLFFYFAFFSYFFFVSFFSAFSFLSYIFINVLAHSSFFLSFFPPFFGPYLFFFFCYCLKRNIFIWFRCQRGNLADFYHWVWFPINSAYSWLCSTIKGSFVSDYQLQTRHLQWLSFVTTVRLKIAKHYTQQNLYPTYDTKLHRAMRLQFRRSSEDGILVHFQGEYINTFIKFHTSNHYF